MREFAKSFYSGVAWKACRDGYRRSVGGLCERCLKRGLYVPGEIVHHVVELTPENINNPAIALSWDNLECVCRDCHGDAHRGFERRFDVDELGRVTAR